MPAVRRPGNPRTREPITHRTQATTIPSLRLLLSLATAAVVATTAAAAAAAAGSSPRLQTPRAAEIARASGAIPDSRLTAKGALRLAGPGDFWGGSFTSNTGESVTVFVSNFYPVNLPVAQGWANFLASLVHGPELSTVQVYLAPVREISFICGPDAVACYTPNGFQIVAPADDPDADLSAEAVVAHEYGHHVEANRSNAPWSSLEYGTKRWSSYMQICAGARTGQFSPGAESVPDYVRNPGEGFAEVYRVLNERTLRLPESPWQVVSRVFIPDEGALAAARLDITNPWRGETTSARSGKLTAKVRSRTIVASTPLDGNLRLSLRHPAKTRFAMTVRSASGAKLAGASGARALSAAATVCGQRSVRIQVRALSGTGTFRLAISKP